MNKILIVCCVIAAVVSVKINSERLQDLKIRLGEMKNQLHNDSNETRSERLREIVENISLMETRNEKNNFLCGMCYSIVDDIFWMRRNQHESDEALRNLVIALCIDLEIQSEEVCHGIVEFNAPSILYIIDKRPELTAATVCKVLLHDGECFNPSSDVNLEFHVKITESNSSLKASNKLANSENNLKIVHITDIHFDPKYKLGAFADCDEHACCREIDDINEIDPQSTAGLWGDYRNCDTPWRAIVDAFHQITKQHSVNFYYASFSCCA
jgi:hypothetical protein